MSSFFKLSPTTKCGCKGELAMGLIKSHHTFFYEADTQEHTEKNVFLFTYFPQ